MTVSLDAELACIRNKIKRLQRQYEKLLDRKATLSERKPVRLETKRLLSDLCRLEDQLSL